MLALLTKAVIGFGTDLLFKLASKPLIEWVFFRVAEGVVKSTETPHDDEFLAKVKEIYNAPKAE